MGVWVLAELCRQPAMSGLSRQQPREVCGAIDNIVPRPQIHLKQPRCHILSLSTFALPCSGPLRGRVGNDEAVELWCESASLFDLVFDFRFG